MAEEKVNQFASLLQAAMYDAVEELKMTQLFLTVKAPSGKQKGVRIIVVPEDMEYKLDDTHGSGKPQAKKQNGDHT
jgi:hypothetical protein